MSQESHVIDIETYHDLLDKLNNDENSDYKIGNSITVMTDNQQGTFNVTVIQGKNGKALSVPIYWIDSLDQEED